MIAVTIATAAVWVAGVCTLLGLHRTRRPAAALVPGPRVSPEDEPVMPTLPVPPFIPSPRSPLS